MISLSENIEKFVENCQNFDELPHCFDDTLVDKLVESVKFDAPTILLIEKLLENLDFEGRCVPIQITIRLLESAIRHGAYKINPQLQDLLIESEQLLLQNRPAKLIDDLFNFYSSPQIFESRKAENWLKIIHWSLNQIDEPQTSVFVRRTLQKFICRLNLGDARRLMIISGVVQIFVRKIDSIHIIDPLTKILEYFVSELVPEESLSIVDTIRNSARQLGLNTIKLLVKLQKTHPGLIIPYTPDKWKYESNRVEAIVHLLEEPAVGAEEQAQMVEMVTVSSAFRIYHQILIIQHMTDAQIDEFLQNLEIRTNDRRLVRITDLALLIPKLKGKVGSERILRFLDHLGDRILESTAIFEALKSSFGEEILAKHQKTRDLLTRGLHQENIDCQILDTCLEAAWMFPCFLPTQEEVMQIVLRKSSESSPYVLTSCLKILRDYFGGIPMEIAQNIVQNCVDPPPRLLTMQWLNETDEKIDEPEKLIESCLEDLDMELRAEAMKMARKYCAANNNIELVLREWIEDKFIGSECREIIGLPPFENPDETILIIEEMLSALKVQPNDDDVMDCY
ncbi:unnamed protein product [Caenorhabditis angaria]|uniref:Uncharacterized protein n=1 Tax=Caenorhabditis angaria TaxID=860376 RepID=A0A9P1MV64_9PELO|nr:unnamed protein product [Caenorhabditis angaria]